MRYALPGLIAFAAATMTGGALFAGPERVPFPEDYATSFTHYLDVDHYGRKTIRRMYASPLAVTRAKAGEALPDGAVLIAEEVGAKTDADGNLVRDGDGRLIALDDVQAVIVMEKNSSWSTENGNWDYAVFLADGTLAPDIDYAPCFTCHESRADRDFNFTFSKFLLDQAR